MYIVRLEEEIGKEQGDDKPKAKAKATVIEVGGREKEHKGTREQQKPVCYLKASEVM